MLAHLAAAISIDRPGQETVEVLVVAVYPPQVEPTHGQPLLHLPDEALATLIIRPPAVVAHLQNEIRTRSRGVVDDLQRRARVGVQIPDNQNPHVIAS